MTATIYDVLDHIRVTSTTNRELGDRFERLMVQYLQLDPLYAEQFSDVWLWSEWADRTGQDVGIDLVAKRRDTGEYCAIQCKFYEPGHYLQKADIDSFFTASGKNPFTSRLIISTTDKWGKNAEEALSDQQIPTSRLRIGDLQDSPIDWSLSLPQPGQEIRLTLQAKNTPRAHQRKAIESVFTGFEIHDRGKMIMACGTGKTFTALKLAERIAAQHRDRSARILFLVPSISLLSQTLREWTAQTTTAMYPFAVCSDRKVGRRDTTEDMSAHDLAFAPTTKPAKLVDQMMAVEMGEGGMVVVFSTYQSISVVSQAQGLGLGDFDLIICDEAHRTTGVTLAGADESQFVLVHDNEFIKSARRLYMTATPRLFDDSTKTAANQNAAELCSMDDETLYGPEFYRLGFGEAVTKGLLTDYKVLILTVDEKYVTKSLQSQLADDNNELQLDDAVKIVGCWNGLAKRVGYTLDGTGFEMDPIPMKRAVAFSHTIKQSKALQSMFTEVMQSFDGQYSGSLSVEVRHVDGTFNALERNHQLDWLKADFPDGECRILSNARCLSEGVDVPSLDAVLFLNPRNSVVDVVQSVGRVMRKLDGKHYGYIILPVGIPADMEPEKALADNKRYKVIWQVLQALRAHDDRFNATVNKIDLNKKKPSNIMVGTVSGGDEGFEQGSGTGSAAEQSVKVARQLALGFNADEWVDAVYAKIVAKVGERTYWEKWSKDVAAIAQRHVDRINVAIDTNPTKAKAFERFLKELRANLNPGVTRTAAIDMLAQHVITLPVFDALFAGAGFMEQNPVSKTMNKMLRQLDDEGLDKEAEALEGFYASVRLRASDIDNHAGRQRVITELYDQFFKVALPKTADAFGIVYTPIEVVDFILRATNQALVKHFGTGFSGKGVQVLDPFTGTGTFIVRLLQSGLISKEDLLRKYTSELHANEVVLLAYYIAAINIEATFHELQVETGHQDAYVPFDGIVLTDTFQMAENPDPMEAVLFPENNKRAKRQRKQNIRVVIGNPPYSAGQTSANDNNANQAYPTLDDGIARTYALRSTGTNKNSLYDSYIRAIRWASDRIKDEGIVAYVSNGGYIDGNTADGLRKSLVDEFSAIYCYNLRGNQRTAGELSRKEGGKIFGAGSRSSIAILILIKDGTKADTCDLYYRDIGDYLSREQKLAKLASEDLLSVDWQKLSPNAAGDWINQRNVSFNSFTPLGDKTTRAIKPLRIFENYSRGLATARDAWVYNFSKDVVASNMQDMIGYYNEQVAKFKTYSESAGVKDAQAAVDQVITFDPKRISWNRALKNDLQRFKKHSYIPDALILSMYRPFTRQHCYFDRAMNDMVYQLPKIFPTPKLGSIGFHVAGPGGTSSFAVLMTESLPDLQLLFNGQFFPLYTYEPIEGKQLSFDESLGSGYRRVENISNEILADYRKSYGSGISKEDIFYYVYGLLHSPEYCTEFESDLKKMLPRIPKVKYFREFSLAGRALAHLHLNYETAEPYPVTETARGGEELSAYDKYRVQKMSFGPNKDRSTILYNHMITLTGVPDEAYRYMLGSRSALELVIDRYQISIHKDSQIKNDPNDWCVEVGNPRYILDLIKRVITVSVETMKIVDRLPELTIMDQGPRDAPSIDVSNESDMTEATVAPR